MDLAGLRNFQWENHGPSHMLSLKELVFKEHLSDVLLYTDDGLTFPAHKMVLSASSQYFKNLFEVCTLNNPVVVIRNMPHIVLRAIVEIMYVGKASIGLEHMKSFVDGAKDFKINHIIDIGDKKVHEIDMDMKIEEEQGKELDLSQNGPSRQITAGVSPSFHEPRESLIPNLIAAPQAHINRNMNPFNSHILNTALAMQSNPQYLASHLSSPARATIPSQMLPRPSPNKLLHGSHNLHPFDTAATAEVLRRFSNSPEDNSNTSLDLTKPSVTSNLSRLNHSCLNAAAIARIQQFQQNKHQPIRVSQSLMKRSCSKSPEVDNIQVDNDNETVDDNRSPQCPQGDQNNSPHSTKQISSAGSSSGEHNNYSEDESDVENRDQECDGHGHQRSLSPCPSTSNPRIMEGLVPNNANFGGLGNWGGYQDDGGHAGSDTAGTSTGFWRNSILAPYLNTALPSISPGSHTSTLSPTFSTIYPSNSLNTSWNSPPPTSLTNYLRGNECSRCGRLYKTRKGLKHHIKNECGVEPRFQCSRCDWKFKQKAHLLRHMARKHTPPS